MSDDAMEEERRLMYGRVHDWHTIEGPCVTKHAGKYYCFFSGGFLCFRSFFFRLYR